jgi:HSP20 family protein
MRNDGDFPPYGGRSYADKECGMKEKIIIDIGQLMDEIFEATKQFSDAMGQGFRGAAEEAERVFRWDDRVDYYPSYSYPPTNVYMDEDKNLFFEFALAGFDSESVDLQFQGDYMILSASIDPNLKWDYSRTEEKDGDAEKSEAKEPKRRYFKRRLKMKDVDKQKYYVPEDKFDRESVKAKYKNGVLFVQVPSKEVFEPQEGVKVEIVNEDKE